jgi:hypothetical protein
MLSLSKHAGKGLAAMYNRHASPTRHCEERSNSRLCYQASWLPQNIKASRNQKLREVFCLPPPQVMPNLFRHPTGQVTYTQIIFDF